MGKRPYSSPLCRDSDPPTSGEAAGLAILDGTVATHEGAILAVLEEMPDGGTGREIAYQVRHRFKLPLNSVQVMRRMRALLDDGLVERRRNPLAEGAFLRRDGQCLHFLPVRRRQMEFEF